LRNASDQFFEWLPPEAINEPGAATPAIKTATTTAKAAPKMRPKSVINAISLLVANTPEGRVGVGALGQYLKRTDPAFSPQTYGHAGLVNMLKTYELLNPRLEAGGHWTVGVTLKKDGSESKTAPASSGDSVAANVDR
jgi:hypothetical protein